jgi:Proteasomal ATPase OB N-terminal domain/Proteasomal ATPase OB C-terminal domain
MRSVLRRARWVAGVLGVLSTALAALLGTHGLAVTILLAVIVLGVGIAVVGLGRGIFRMLIDIIDSGDRSERLCRWILAIRGHDRSLESVLSAAALTAPRQTLPRGFGIVLKASGDGTVDVFTGGRATRVSVSPNVEPGELRLGQEVALNEELNVVIASGYEPVGEVVILKELLADSQRALVISLAGQERVVRLVELLLHQTLHGGDRLLFEPRSGYVYERIPGSGPATSRPRGLRAAARSRGTEPSALTQATER